MVQIGLKTCAIADLLSVNRFSQDSCNHHHLQPNTPIRIIGVDISEQRLQLCKNIITKYHVNKITSGENESHTKSIKDTEPNKSHQQEVNSQNHPPIQPRISLYCTDGTTFGTKMIDSNSLIFDSIVALEEEIQKGSRKRMNKSARARQRKRLRSLALEEHRCYDDEKNSTRLDDDDNDRSHDHNKHTQVEDTAAEPNNSDGPAVITLFDRVLVDAECSTDGAVRHLQQRYKKSEEKCNIKSNPHNSNHDYTQNQKLTDVKKLADLVDLQKRLLESGFRLLKPGGVLVYSTCSLASEQNENVVSWLLKTYKDEAYIIPVMFSGAPPAERNGNSMIYEGSVKGSVRFHPNVCMKNVDIPDSSDAQGSSIKYLFGGGFFLVKLGKKNKTR